MTPAETVGLVLTIALVLAIYWLPSFIAFKRGLPNRWAIFVLNIFAGAGGVTYLIALVWSLMDVERAKVSKADP
jgi:hypothetical protein